MQPNETLRNAVRAGFVNQNSSLNKYCEDNEIDQSNASKALGGKWQGEKATQLCWRLIVAAKIEIPPAAPAAANPEIGEQV